MFCSDFCDANLWLAINMLEKKIPVCYAFCMASSHARWNQNIRVYALGSIGHDKEIPQTHTADQPTAPQGRAVEY